MKYISRNAVLATLAVAVIALLPAGCATTDITENPNVMPPDTTVGSQAIASERMYRVLESGLDTFEPEVRSYDILHTRLQLSFDLPSEELHGIATHRLTPREGHLDSLFFHARFLDIHSVTLTHAGWTDTLRVSHFDNGFSARPVEPLRAFDTVNVAIDYTANPRRSESILGIHFVDGSGDDPSLPTQVWTLSQPEDARFWFPTWDKPDDFMTFEIELTVPDSLDAFANGELISSFVEGGMRTNVWRLNQPHVPYLTAFAVGRYEAVPDSFRRADGTVVPLQYIVEPEYAPYAYLIFGETPRMIEVFEDRLGVRYPWPNYRQVTAQQFTAGGMEHTTLSTMSSRLQVDSRAHLDYSGRDLIAHELVHQWFGNLVTSADWANLALNEGFASYMEEVYLADAHGEDAAQEHAISDLRGYMRQAQSLRRPIIWFGYSDPYDLYDSHTYQKAARVLNMLRFELGEAAWWDGVNAYLEEHRHQNTTAHDLQRVMEAASGRDLSTFFEQWFHSPGHPELIVDQRAADAFYEVRIHQVQDATAFPIFHFDLPYVVSYAGREPHEGRLRVETADTTLRIATAGEIDYVQINPNLEVLAEVQTRKPLKEWMAQARFGRGVAARIEAVTVLSELERTPEIRQTLISALHDEYDFVRMSALAGLSRDVADDAEVRRVVAMRALDDESARMRAAAVSALADAPADDPLAATAIKDALHDSSYAVVASGVTVAADRNPTAFSQEVAHLYELASWQGRVETALLAASASIDVDERYREFVERQTNAARPANVRLAAVRAVAALAERGALDVDAASRVFNRLLQDVDQRVRSAAEASAAEFSSQEDDG